MWRRRERSEASPGPYHFTSAINVQQQLARLTKAEVVERELHCNSDSPITNGGFWRLQEGVEMLDGCESSAKQGTSVCCCLCTSLACLCDLCPCVSTMGSTL